MIEEYSQGEEILIATGDDLIALRSVQPGATEYARREYGVTDEEMRSFVKACDQRYQRLKAEGKLVVMTEEDLRQKLEEISRH